MLMSRRSGKHLTHTLTHRNTSGQVLTGAPTDYFITYYLIVYCTGRLSARQIAWGDWRISFSLSKCGSKGRFVVFLEGAGYVLRPSAAGKTLKVRPYELREASSW